MININEMNVNEKLHANGITKPVKMAHVVLRTSQYSKLLEWYRLVFGAEVVYENGQLAFLTYDEEHHRIAILEIPGLDEQPQGTVGVHHVAFTYHSLRDLMDTYARLRENGITPIYPINHGPTTSLYYADPDGNQLELQVENYDSVEESTQFFFSDAFAENPIGVEFDPEELLARLNSGEPEQELKKRPDVGAKDLSDVTKLR